MSNLFNEKFEDVVRAGKKFTEAMDMTNEQKEAFGEFISSIGKLMIVYGNSNLGGK